MEQVWLQRGEENEERSARMSWDKEAPAFVPAIPFLNMYLREIFKWPKRCIEVVEDSYCISIVYDKSKSFKNITLFIYIPNVVLLPVPPPRVLYPISFVFERVPLHSPIHPFPTTLPLASPFPGAPSLFRIRHILSHWDQIGQPYTTYVPGATDQPMYALWLVA